MNKLSIVNIIILHNPTSLLHEFSHNRTLENTKKDEVLKCAGEKWKRARSFSAYALMKSVDDNSDGFISYPEFADHFVKQNYSFKS